MVRHAIAIRVDFAGRKDFDGEENVVEPNPILWIGVLTVVQVDPEEVLGSASKGHVESGHGGKQVTTREHVAHLDVLVKHRSIGEVGHRGELEGHLKVAQTKGRVGRIVGPEPVANVDEFEGLGRGERDLHVVAGGLCPSEVRCVSTAENIRVGVVGVLENTRTEAHVGRACEEAGACPFNRRSL